MRETQSNRPETDETVQTDDDPLGGLSDELNAEQPATEPDDTEATTPNDVEQQREQEQPQPSSTDATDDTDTTDESGPRPRRASEDLGARLTVNLYKTLGVRSSSMFKRAEAVTAIQLGEGNVIEKNRHWYPLIFELGLDAIEDMDDEELTAALLAYDDDRSLEN